jgi:hypothetical protein
MENFGSFIEDRIVGGRGGSNVKWSKPLVLKRAAGLNGAKPWNLPEHGPDSDLFEHDSTMPRNHCRPISLVKAANRGSSRRLSKRGSTLM